MKEDCCISIYKFNMKRAKNSDPRASQKLILDNPEIFIKEIKKKKDAITRSLKTVQPETLNFKQKMAFDIVERHAVTWTSPFPSLKLIVTGLAGTGKSHLIHAISTMLTKRRKKFRVMSFTGVSSFLIQGTTIHKGFCLPYFYRNSLPNDQLKAAKLMLKDEMSMIGLHLFGYMNERLKLIFDDKRDWGGKNCLLFGDLGQVRPIADFPLFRKDPVGELEKSGAAFYQSFDKCINLDQQMRQLAPEEEEFRVLLTHVRKGEISDAEVAMLNKRFVRNITKEEQDLFLNDAIHLFGENEAADTYNTFRLNHLGATVVEIRDEVSASAPSSGEQVLKLAVGARVMLIKNLWIEAGLYNGALGTVTEIGPVDEEDEEDEDDEDRIMPSPSYVFVKFDKYLGPGYQIRPTTDIPIPKCSFPNYDSVSERSWTRTNFPLHLAFGITVHKSQGCTLKRLCMGLPNENSREGLFYKMSPSLAFVALSRVRGIKDLAINKLFDPAIVTYAKGNYFHGWVEEEKRLQAIEEKMMSFKM